MKSRFNDALAILAAFTLGALVMRVVLSDRLRYGHEVRAAQEWNRLADFRLAEAKAEIQFMRDVQKLQEKAEAALVWTSHSAVCGNCGDTYSFQEGRTPGSKFTSATVSNHFCAAKEAKQ